MDQHKYLNMNSDELYDILVTDALANPQEGREVIHSLMESQRFREDYAFRLSVQTVNVMMLATFAENDNMIKMCTDLIEKASAFEMWQLVSTNQNLLGNYYLICGFHERALEQYLKVVKIEEKHGLIAMTSIAYNNIALIYDNLQDNKKTLKYLTYAIEALKRVEATRHDTIQNW